MSIDLYPIGGLRFWDEYELLLRDQFTNRIKHVIFQALKSINPAWQMCRVEGPILTPASALLDIYDGEDVFMTNHDAAGDRWALRPETTHSSYVYAKHLIEKGSRLPMIFWQSGRSYRRELNDGASPAKLRYNEFNQLEFQCIYAADSKADYRECILKPVELEIAAMIQKPTIIAPSDRLPPYSESTLDVEAILQNGDRREMASISIRNDFGDRFKVLEIAIGLDRLIDVRKQ